MPKPVLYYIGNQMKDSMPNTQSYYFTDEQFETMCERAERYANMTDEEYIDDLYPELTGDEYADAVLSTLS